MFSKSLQFAAITCTMGNFSVVTWKDSSGISGIFSLWKLFAAVFNSALQSSKIVQILLDCANKLAFRGGTYSVKM